MNEVTKKEHLARKALAQVLEEFHHPSVPDPVITNEKREDILRVDEKTWQIELSVWRDLPLEGEDLLRYYRCLWCIGISYYLTCPYDMETAIELLTSAISASDRETGQIIANLFVEMVVQYSLARTLPEDTIWFRKVREQIEKPSTPRERFHKVFTLVLELLLEQRIMSKRFHETVSEKDRLLAAEIARIIRRKGVLNKGSWATKVRDIAKLLYEDVEGAGGFKGVKHLFPRNVRKNNIFKAFLAGGKKIQESKKVEAALMIYKTAEGEPLASAAALYSSGSVKSPKEAARYWYRARAADILRLDLQKAKKEEFTYQGSPDIWRLSDPAEELDVLLSLSSFPVLIPNQTTKKWGEEQKVTEHRGSYPPDMLVVLDSSNSMYSPPEGAFLSYKERKKMERKMKQFDIKYPYKSKLDMAVVAGFSALESAVKRNCRMAAINFSGKYDKIGWTEERREVEDTLLKFRGDGTEFPIRPFEDLIRTTKTRPLIFVITDSAIYNEEETIQTLSKAARESYLFLFKIGTSTEGMKILKEVENAGGRVVMIDELENLIQLAGEKVQEYYSF